MSDKPLIWKGKELKTMGDISNVVEEIIGLPDEQAKAEAKKFIETYEVSIDRREGVVASNIGYLSGYYDTDTMKRIQTIFAVQHPVFGNAVPTPKEAFEAGIKAGEKIAGRSS